MKTQCPHWLSRLARDEKGSVGAAAFLFMTALLAIGVMVGVVTLREHIVTEFGDVAVALDNLSQSFSYSVSIDTDNDGMHDTVVASASYTDDAATLMDDLGDAPACLDVDVAPIDEGDALTPPTGDFP